ncbi:hypothetical protein SAMN04487968_10397 [Nocardioides terrae]|uniref:Uncharacterized protein n=1 Tax=Nocardioides terrae TaxID=574651 RepID=A0A1I1FYB6_9ACTN|nr:hypothetical protein [Nocardioides terrae]SFC01940.1 hypothetical protein SAMN04487968_10397 [Nocardioides terrae]
MGHEAGLREPVATPLRRALRQAVLDHAVAERRPAHLPILHVGLPGARQVVHPIRPDEATDHALRADVVAAMVRRVAMSGTPLVWLTRSGELIDQDVDTDWLAGARQALGEAGLPLVFVVVNRHGWRDPRSRLETTWVRMRPRSDRR